MRRVALMVAAVGVLGTGCVVEKTCAPGQMTLNWAFYDSAAETAPLAPFAMTCGTASVAWIRVFVNGVQEVDSSGTPAEFLCADYPNGVILDGFGDANNEVIVEGLDTSGAVVLYRSIDTLASSCGVNNAYEVSPARGTVRVQYTIPTSETYFGYIWYSLSDVTFSPPDVFYSINNASPNPLLLPAVDGDFLQYQVPFGNYVLDWIGNVNGAVSGWVFWDQNCTGVAADVTTTGETLIPVDMHVVQEPNELYCLEY